MDNAEIEDYVGCALALAGYHFDAAQCAAVTAEFAQIAAIAAELLETPLPLELEPVTLFRP